MSARPARRQTFYGWTIVAVCFACSALSSPGQSFAIALFIDDLIVDLGISRLTLSSLYGVMTLAAAATLPLLGRLADRIPSRAFLIGVFVAFGLAIAGFGLVRGVVSLAIVWYALRLLGQGAMSLGTITLVVRWFARRRARALSIVGLGFAAGEMLFPAAIAALMLVVGWRWTLAAIAITYLVVFTPLVAVLVRDRDAAREPLDGREPIIEPSGTPRVAAVAMTFTQARQTSTFWYSLVLVAIMPMLMTGLLFHQIGIWASVGWATSSIPAAFFAYAWGGVLASVAGGFALDHIDVRWGLLLGAVTGAGAVAVLAFGGDLVAGPIAYGSLLGAAGGFATVSNSVLWPSYFGIQALGSIKGVVNAVRNGATALGPPMIALLLTDASHTVRWGSVLALFGVMFVLAAGLRPPRLFTVPEDPPTQ